MVVFRRKRCTEKGGLYRYLGSKEKVVVGIVEYISLRRVETEVIYGKIDS